MRPPAEYNEEITNPASNVPNPRDAIMVGNRLAGRAIVRVVAKCNDAQENNNLDLSDCQLMQVPDAIYLLLQNTELNTCDLSNNDITKISPKLVLKFNLITDLKLSHNQIANLPDELGTLARLLRLDISYNTFVSLPSCVFKAPNLKKLEAGNNHIVDVDVEEINGAPSLQDIDLTNNPLKNHCQDQMMKITRLSILVSPRVKEDWDNLNI